MIEDFVERSLRDILSSRPCAQGSQDGSTQQYPRRDDQGISESQKPTTDFQLSCNYVWGHYYIPCTVIISKHTTLPSLHLQILSWLAVGFRLHTRIRVVREPWWDDLFVFLAALFNLVSVVAFLAGE